jgi:hypothetical protein
MCLVSSFRRERQRVRRSRASEKRSSRRGSAWKHSSPSSEVSGWISSAPVDPGDREGVARRSVDQQVGKLPRGSLEGRDRRRRTNSLGSCRVSSPSMTFGNLPAWLPGSAWRNGRERRRSRRPRADIRRWRSERRTSRRSRRRWRRLENWDDASETRSPRRRAFR